MVDYIVLALIFVSAVFGLIRGVVSQLMALVGLVAAYFLAPDWGRHLGGLVQEQLGCTRFMADRASIFLVGVGIYIACRLVGYGIEKLVVERVKEAKNLNRMGGAVLGAVKTMAMIAILFFFTALIPRDMVRTTVPKLLDSATYRLAAEYNPMGRQQVIERMRIFRSTVANSSKSERLAHDPEMRKLLTEHGLKNALDDERFVHSLKDGDFEKLRKYEQVEDLMKDEKLVDLLDHLNQQPPG
ncbi:MAG TPA: CvpA family protein [Bdellovibrionota bacterium]|nr:CvpA family protein [Bdellovibrionota bacterium]